MRPLVAIEGDEIVVRVKIDAIPGALQFGIESGAISEGFEGFVVTDAPAFAKGMVRAMLEEEEDGATDIHWLLDTAMTRAIENGAEGCEDTTTPPATQSQGGAK